MAHKMEFIKGDSLPELGAAFDELIAHYSKDDARYIITPVGFVSEGLQGYVIAIHVEQPWKTRWEEPNTKTDEG